MVSTVGLLLVLHLVLLPAETLATAATVSLVVLVHLHPPIDYAPQSRFSRYMRREQEAEPPTLLHRPARRERVQELMQRFVRDSQTPASEFIRQSFQTSPQLGAIVDITPLWIQNTLVVRVQLPAAPSAADAAAEQHQYTKLFFKQTLQWVPGVRSVEFDHAAVRLLDPARADSVDNDTGAEEDNGQAFDAMTQVTGALLGDKPQNNIGLLHAPDLWSRGVSGKGVVVANIDSGVRYTHETLRSNFRGALGVSWLSSVASAGSVNFDYAFWFTPGTDMSKETPDTADMVGHGTHTMGTVVGDKGIGVAPGATWITARAFDIYGAANKSDFLLAAQWVICPTKMDGSGRNCSLGADIVSNSFGIDRSAADFKDWQWMSDVVHTWRAAGSIPVFASGNTNGFLCGSVYYPGSLQESVAVGALIGGHSLWGASGKGPVFDDDDNHKSGDDSSPSEYGMRVRRRALIKPDLVAPGVGIRSALSTKDNTYTRLTGTSMATPHVAGAIALLLSLPAHYQQNEGVSTFSPVEDFVTVLKQTATRDLSKPFLVPSTCGNTSYDEYPNNIYGWGMPNVCLAANELGFSCSVSGGIADKNVSEVGTLLEIE